MQVLLSLLLDDLLDHSTFRAVDLTGFLRDNLIALKDVSMASRMNLDFRSQWVRRQDILNNRVRMDIVIETARNALKLLRLYPSVGETHLPELAGSVSICREVFQVTAGLP